MLSPDSEVTQHLKAELEAVPNLAGVDVVIVDSEDDIEDYATDDDYEDGPKLCFGVAFDDTGDDLYKYSIRFNETEAIPDGEQRIGEEIDIFSIDWFEPTDELIREPHLNF